MDFFLLAPKLRIPPQPHHGVHRARLVDALERGILYYKLVLISAPAGYGKTTLLSQWAHARRFLKSAGCSFEWARFCTSGTSWERPVSTY